VIKNKISVDTIITDATIYSVNNSFQEFSAMAIDKGKIVAIGTNSDISKQYESKKYNRWGWQVYLSRIDAHCHFTAMD
jgi:predicted amidohydrolase YtcJ